MGLAEYLHIVIQAPDIIYASSSLYKQMMALIPYDLEEKFRQFERNSYPNANMRYRLNGNRLKVQQLS
jgi:hypothetical protein